LYSLTCWTYEEDEDRYDIARVYFVCGMGTGMVKWAGHGLGQGLGMGDVETWDKGHAAWDRHGRAAGGARASVNGGRCLAVWVGMALAWRCDF